MRIRALVTLATGLAACSSPSAEPEPDGIEIACGIGRDAALEERCVVDVVPSPSGQTYLIHRPDGGFRRIQVDSEGRYIAADGADAVVQQDSGEGTVLRIAGEAYLIPHSDEPLGAYD